MALDDTDLSLSNAGNTADRMRAERAACEGFATEVLDHGIIAAAFDALAACVRSHDKTSREACHCAACVNARRVLRDAGWRAGP